MKFLVFSFLFIGLLEALPSAKSGKDSLADAHQKLNAPVSRAATGKCQDLYEECGDWARRGACESARFTHETKRTYCGVTCGLCGGTKSKPSNNSDNTEDKASSEMNEKLSKAMEAMAKPLGELINNLNDLVKAAKAKLAELAKQNGDDDSS